VVQVIERLSSKPDFKTRYHQKKKRKKKKEKDWVGRMA
jgi:hypothetical protein